MRTAVTTLAIALSLSACAPTLQSNVLGAPAAFAVPPASELENSQRGKAMAEVAFIVVGATALTAAVLYVATRPRSDNH